MPEVEAKTHVPLVEGRDYYREGPYVVFTAEYHLRRGSCCGSGCRHCPWRDGRNPATTNQDPDRA